MPNSARLRLLLFRAGFTKKSSTETIELRGDSRLTIDILRWWSGCVEPTEFMDDERCFWCGVGVNVGLSTTGLTDRLDMSEGLFNVSRNARVLILCFYVKISVFFISLSRGDETNMKKPQ